MATTTYDIRTYTGLKAAVKDYLGRDDLDNQIPQFISMAELRLNRELRMRVMERRATTVVPAGRCVTTLPWKRVAGDWDVFMEMRDLVWLPNSGESINLSYMPPEEYGVLREQTGMPKRYTIIGRDLHIIPTPEDGGTLTLTYYAEIPPLSSSQETNDVLLTAPDVYLYAALVESAPYTRGSAPVELWTQYYKEARDKLGTNETRARFTANIAMKTARRV